MNKSTAMDIIDMESYDSGYATGYVTGCDEGYEAGYKSCQLEYQKDANKRESELLYLRRTRTLGAVLMLISALSVWILDGDVTFAFIGTLLGGVLLFGNGYYYKTEDERK